MPAASSDFGFIHDSSLEDLPAKKDKVSSIRQLDPDRISYFPIHSIELQQLRDTLGPDEEAIAASQNPEFKTAEFYASQVSNADSQAIYNQLFANPKINSINVEDKNLSLWQGKYGAFIPSRWFTQGPVVMRQDLDNLLAYATQHPDTFTIHPYLIDACIEYPNLNKRPFKIDLYVGQMLPLNYAQLAVLEAKNRHDPELYTNVYARQLRRGGVINDHPTQDSRYDRIQRSREDQLINRLIFESTPVGLRKSLFRRK